MQKSNIKTSGGKCHRSNCGERIRKSHRELYVCANCGLTFCGRHVYSYVDGNNRAITQNAPLTCTSCMSKTEERKLDAVIELTDLFPDDFKLNVLQDIAKFNL